MDADGFKTPDPNFAGLGDGSVPPPPPLKQGAHMMGDINQNLNPIIADASSSLDEEGSDTVIRKRNSDELQYQIALLQGELARRQARVTSKQPSKSPVSPTIPSLQPTPATGAVSQKRARLLAPPVETPTGEEPRVPALPTDLHLTKVPIQSPVSPDHRQPISSSQADPTYNEEEVDSEGQPRNHPCLEDMRELIRREIAEAGLQPSNKGPSTAFQISLSPLSKEILNLRFPKKFTSPSFEYYSGFSDPIQHLRHYQDKMAVYSYDDRLLCRMFPSSLKGLASDWFYSLKAGSLHTFEQLAKAFQTQYSSCQEYRRTSNHLFTVKMNQDESLKDFLTRFQSERAKVHNCSDDVAAAAFISGLSTSYDLYASTVKHSVTDMSEILCRTQGHIQLEEARRSVGSATPKDKGKPPQAPSSKNNAQTRSGGNSNKKPPSFNNQRTFNQNVKEASMAVDTSPFNTPINKIFSAIRDQP